MRRTDGGNFVESLELESVFGSLPKMVRAQGELHMELHNISTAWWISIRLKMSINKNWRKNTEKEEKWRKHTLSPMPKSTQFAFSSEINTWFSQIELMSHSYNIH